MKHINRPLITTLLGILLGFATVGLYRLGSPDMPLPVEITARMVISIGFLGFTLGVSSLQWHWALHGLFFGAVVGTIEGLASNVVGGQFEIPLIGCLIFGLLIEWITTKGFKAQAAIPQQQPI